VVQLIYYINLITLKGEGNFTNSYPYPPNWKSLTEPASLPLTTDYFPSPTDLYPFIFDKTYTASLTSSRNKMYTEYNTIISLVDENLYQNNTEALLRELISQRLSQGYQLVVLSEQDPRVAQETGTKKTYSLSVGHDYHKLTFDMNESNIEIKVYC
jgi:hypothetical protein